MARKTDLTVVQGGAPAPSASSHKQAAQVIGNFEVPYAYEIWADGVYHVAASSPDDPMTPSLKATPGPTRRANLRRLTHQPIWIRRFGHVLEHDEQIVELAYRDSISEEIVTLWADRHQIAAKLTILLLAKKGVPVNEGNAQAVIAFLDACLNLNGPRLECVNVLGRSGAYTLPEGTGWLIGDRWIGPTGTRVIPDPRTRGSITRGFTVSGSETAWFDMFKKIAAQGPVARWLLYSTFAAPLLRLVKQRTFIIHHWCESGGGKTAIAKFCMSANGDPNVLTMSFNRTEKSFTEVFEYLSDVQVCFDELQATDREMITKIVYWLCLEKKRVRTAQIGGLQEGGAAEAGWKSIVRMTGEEPVIGKGNSVDLGGQANRIVQIGTAAIPSALALEIHQWLEQQHFGWGGMRFLEKLVYVMSAAPSEFGLVLAERYAQIRDEIVKRCGSNVVQERAAHLAVVALAEYLANRWLFDADPAGALEGAIQDAVAVGQVIAADEVRETVTEQALQLFQDHFQSRRASWFDLSDPIEAKALAEGRYKSLVGVLHKDEVWLVQQEANAILKRAGLPPRRVWTDLRRSGILYVPQSCVNSFGVPRRYGRFYAKVYVLTRPTSSAGSVFEKAPAKIADVPPT